MKTKYFNLLRWLPVIASVALVGLIIFISALTVAKLKEATHWRKQTFQAVLDAQTYEDNLINAQSHLRRYAAAGTPDLLIEYKNDTNSEIREFNQLTELTPGNSEPQQRLKKLGAAMQAVFALDDRVIGIYARQGAAAAAQLEAQGADAVDTAVEDLEKYKSDEEQLLDKRDTTEQTDYHQAAHWLVGGSLLAAILLVVSNYVAGREMGRRRRAEARQNELIAELQNALAEVKTLSGFIPICGWCKKVRSDEGFWQSVEQYVSTHT
ncbi:MAG TPA: CHASE3 domain-containing protein, partial [Dongiaceae bacterium]|nr:CHASE3 domain-containing protein [Dongiaceae bacterium]